MPSLCFDLNRSCRSTLSGDMPRTMAPAFSKSARCRVKSIASAVQPVVSSFGIEEQHHDFAAKLCEPNRLAAIPRQLEFRSGLSFSQISHFNAFV